MGRNPGAYGVVIVAACLVVAVAEASGLPSSVEVAALELSVRERPSPAARKLGVLRGGAVVRVQGRVKGHECPAGWLRIEGEGYVCSSYVHPSASEVRPSPREPHLGGELAAYGRVRTGPTKACRNARSLSRGSDSDDDCRVIPSRAILRLDHQLEPGGWAWRTLSGELLRSSAVALLSPHAPEPGQRVEGEITDGRAILRRESPVRSEPSPQGELLRTLPQHAHVTVGEERGGYQQVEGGGWVPRIHLRRIRLRERPGDLPEGSHWLAVDVREQTLVAYEGDRPVFATLASTGRGWSWTPDGTYRIHKKAVSDTMSNRDSGNTYLVEDVPWVLYYEEERALHGAFWHESLGDRVSHGCVNLALADARWVFDWSEPALPRGWHAVLEGPGRRGTAVVVFR